MKKLALFDFDGTLVDSMGSIFKGVSYVFTQSGCNPPDFTDYILNFRFPFGTFYRERGVPLSDDGIFKIYLEGLGYYTPQFFDDAKAIISSLHEAGYVACVVTANREENVLRALENAGLDGCVNYRCAMEKTETIRELVAQSTLGSRTAYVGDVVADIKDASAAGAYPVAVLRNGMMKLAPEFHKVGAKMCVSSLKHLKLV